jgi:hypothetical protein
LFEALERLKETLAGAPPGAGECLDWIEERTRADSIPDDVAMLAMSVAS